MKKKFLAALTASAVIVSMAGCGAGEDRADADGGAQAEGGAGEEDTEIQVFIAASLDTVMTELADLYHEEHPHVKITFNADSSGTLLTQIREGYECDIFFSAAQKQMDDLEADGLMVEGTRANVVNNQVVVSGCRRHLERQRDSGHRAGRHGESGEYRPGRRKRAGWQVYKTGAHSSGDTSGDERPGVHYHTGGLRGSGRRGDQRAG